MSHITLKPLDDGQKAVEIPLGKTTIGRGPFLGCSDKKVSRNHAVLEVTNKGEVYLTPTHVNPCFYQPTAESPGQILKKDIPHKLENGDSFSLLPRAYRYQLSVVTAADENKSNEENDLKKEVGKTNGSAGEGPEEAVKDALKGECTEEQGDTIVAEKTFSKDEEPPENTEKKEENNFSQKLVDMQDEEHQKSDLPKENNSVPPKSSPEEPPAENSPSEHSKPEESEDAVALNTSQPSLSPVELPEPAQKEPKQSPLASQNELSNKPSKESEPVESNADPADPPDDEDEPAKVEDSPKEEDSTAAENEDKKEENSEEAKEEEMEDPESPKAEEEDPETGKSSPVRTEEPATPSKRPRKRGPAKQATPKKQTPKRKPASESSPKPKGRKKTKFTFDDDGGEGSSQRQVGGRTSSRTNRQTRQGLSLEDFIVSDDDEWQSDHSSERPKQQQRRRRRRDSDSGSDWETEHKKPKKPAHKLGSGSESGSDWGTQRKRKGGPRGKRRKTKSTTSEPGSEEETEQSTSNAAKSDKPRIPCTYGKKCYRRHPNHTEQFSHPGDSDYTSEPEDSQKEAAVSESEPDESPKKKECPYGANCFRKNPQHKKDFKHTKKVRPQREAAKQADKKTKSSRNSEEVDTYDINDSLLNDDSADEYKPMDSGSDYESGEKAKRTAKGRRGRRTA